MKDPKGSGFLKGGGTRRYRQRKLRRGGNFPDVYLSDPQEVKRVVPDFDPELEFAYSDRELLLLAEKILLEDPKSPLEDPAVLSWEKLLDRQRREVYNVTGLAQQHVASGIYWRTHPQGRKWNSKEQRQTGGRGFYR